MAVDKNKLLELYSIVLEEARHHDRLFTQIWVAGVIAGGILLTALSLSLRQPSLVSKSSLLWPVIGFGSLLLMCFYWSICRHASEARKCRDIARNIEDILTGKIPEEAIKLNNLLVMGKVKEMRVPWDKEVYSPLVDPAWRLFYPVMLLLVWVAISLAVAGYIG